MYTKGSKQVQDEIARWNKFRWILFLIINQTRCRFLNFYSSSVANRISVYVRAVFQPSSLRCSQF